MSKKDNDIKREEKSGPQEYDRKRYGAPFRSNENWLMQVSIALAILFAFRLAYYALLYGLNPNSYDLENGGQAVSQIFQFYVTGAIILPLFMWLSPFIVKKLFPDNYLRRMTDFSAEGKVKNGLYSNGLIFAAVLAFMLAAMQYVFYNYVPYFTQNAEFALLHVAQVLTLSIGIAEFGSFTYYNAFKSKLTDRYGFFPYVVTVLVTTLAEYSVRTLFIMQLLPTMMLRLAIVFAFHRPNGVKWKIAVANFILLLVTTDIILVEVPTTNVVMALMLIYLLFNRYREINLTRSE